MNRFSGLTPCMRVEILIDPDTGDYQLDLDGSVEVIKKALLQVLNQLEDKEIIKKLKVDYV